MALITIVLKNEATKQNNIVKHITSYNSDIAPKVGEYVQVDGQPSYEVDRVIHRFSPSAKSNIIIIEVKEVEIS